MTSPVGTDSPAAAAEEQPDRPANGLAPVDRRIYVVAGGLFLILMALSGRYGFHRDELYFLDCARHLAPAYVDQPVFSPLVARLTLWVFGVSLPGLRLWPALAGAGTVMMAGFLAREFGGGRTAQLLGALGTATMPSVLGADHQFGPTSFDLLFWTALAFLVARIGRTGDVRLWAIAGAVLGLGLANKESIGFFACALVCGVLLSGGGRLLTNRWFFAGALIAVAFTFPDLWWQATHGWPTVAMTHQLNRENGGVGHVTTWVVGQLFQVTLALAWLWVVGIRFLWRSGRAPWKALVWAYAILFVLFGLTTGGKVYYLSAAYIYLLAAGAVCSERWLESGQVRLKRLVALTAVTTVLALPVVLPLLPVGDAGWTYGLNPQLGETVGWPELVGTVRTAWHALPPDQRRHAVIFTADYGEAGAINELDRGTSGLPTAVSGQNNAWLWGPGDPRATTILAVAPGPVDVTGYADYLKDLCSDVRTVATIRNPAGIHNQEWNGHVYVCTGLKRPWGETWALLRHDS